MNTIEITGQNPNQSALQAALNPAEVMIRGEAHLHDVLDRLSTEHAALEAKYAEQEKQLASLKIAAKSAYTMLRYALGSDNPTCRDLQEALTGQVQS